jgi:hypothetical protein
MPQVQGKDLKFFNLMNQLTATGQLYGKTVTIKRISKAAAKKLFANGVEIYLQSSNFYPFGVWQSVCPIQKNDLAEKGYSFESATNSFQYYNCSSEQGRYVHFYTAI